MGNVQSQKVLQKLDVNAKVGHNGTSLRPTCVLALALAKMWIPL